MLNELDDNPWSWLLKSRKAKHHPVDEALKIAEQIEDLPRTAATFRPRDVINRHDIVERLLVVNNSWIIPDRFTRPNWKDGGVHAINPNYVHRQTYAEAPVVCECGATIDNAGNDADMDCELETCNSIWINESLTSMWRKRRQILIQSAALARSPKYTGARIGVDPSTLNYIKSRVHVDRKALIEQSSEMMGDVLCELRDDYNATQLSKIFNRHQSTIRRKWR